MKLQTRTSKIVAGLALTVAGAGAHAAVITSSADPLLVGASVITFSEVATGTLDPTINGVAFTGSGTQLNTINAAFSGQTAPILGNSAVLPFNSVAGVSFTIDFGTSVSAFSADFAAVNGTTTTLSAFDANDVLLGSVNLPNINSGVAETWGLGGAGWSIDHVLVTTDDFFFTDNLRYVENATGRLPEPGSVALVGLALLGLGAARRAGKR